MKIKWITISFISVLLLISLISFVVTDEEPPPEDPPGFWNGAKLPIGMTENQYNYDPISKIITDSNGLTFKRLNNGGVKINNERFLAFAITGKIGEVNYKKSILDFDWTWYLNETDDGHVFYAINYAENNNTAFKWTQYYHFYENPWRQMKIQHYVENNMATITETKMYYMTNVLDGDTIEYNGTKYMVNDHMGTLKQGDLNDIISRVNFNSGYDFVFDDLIADGFDITDFYIGSGAPLGKPNINITAIGFTKGNGIFPNGTSIWVDPTFTTDRAGSIAITPLDDDELIIVWCDENANDVEFQHYYINGTPIGSQVPVDDSFPSCASRNGLSASAFNSTHFVIGWVDKLENIISFRVYDSGTPVTGIIDVDTDVAGSLSVSTSAFNSTHFVISWHDDEFDYVSFKTYLYNGTNLTGIIDADQSVLNSNSVPVSAFNSTHFVISWQDKFDKDASFKTYLYNGTNLTGIIDADDTIGLSFAVDNSAFNSTHFVIGWFDEIDDDASFKIYLYNGTNLTGIIDADIEVGNNSDSISVSAMNSSYFVIGWFDEVEENYKFAVYDSDGNLKAGPTVSSSTGDIIGFTQFQTLSSYQAATNIGFKDPSSNPLFIHAYPVSTSQADWRVYNADGSPYEQISPTWSNNMTDDTNIKYNDTVQFNVTWSDNFGLSGWIFNSNITGTEVNSTFNTTWGPNNESTYYIRINVSLDQDLFYRFYANDTSNNWNETYKFVFTVMNPAPSWSNNITNDTQIQFNETVVFNTTWEDETGLSGWIFNSNITGTEVNSTFNTTFGPNNESTYTLKVNVSEGEDFFYRFYANNTGNNWTATDKFVITMETPWVEYDYYMVANWTGHYNESGCTDDLLWYLSMHNISSGLGFNFPFYNETILSTEVVFLDREGRLLFTPDDSDDTPTTPEFLEEKLIAPRWTHYAGTSADGIYACVNQGVFPNRYAVFRWDGQYNYEEGTIQTEIVLYENGTIQLNYGIVQDQSGTDDAWYRGISNANSGQNITASGTNSEASNFGQVYRPYNDTIDPQWSNNITNDTHILPNDLVGFNVTWSDANLAGWIFNSNITGIELNSSFNTTFGPNGESTYYIVVNVSLDQDIFYRFYANDTSNNWGETDKFNFTVANEVPVIPNIIAPANNTYWNYTPINLQYNATDIDSDTLTYYIYINGTLNGSTTGNWSFNASDGFYNWSVVAGDGIDNSSNSSTWNFTIDTINPTLNITSPVNGTSYSAKTIALTLTNTDTNLDYCFFNVTKTASGDLEGARNRSADCSNTTSLVVDLLTDYTVNIYSFDLAGNSNSSSIEFTTTEAELEGGSGPGGGGGGGVTTTREVEVVRVCGDGVCASPLENVQNCPNATLTQQHVDFLQTIDVSAEVGTLGDCLSSCGDGICWIDESSARCPADCLTFAQKARSPVVLAVTLAIALVIFAYAAQQKRLGKKKKFRDYFRR